jgi:hypothetical protein
MLRKFHSRVGKEIPLGICFTEKSLGEDLDEVACVPYDIDSGEERRSPVVARVLNGAIPKNSDGGGQVNVVQCAGQKQTYMMSMALRGALRICPNDDND